MKKRFTRREFIKASTGTALGTAVGSLTLVTGLTNVVDSDYESEDMKNKVLCFMVGYAF